MELNILIDSREKQPWDFSFSPYCIGQTVCYLKTADYSLRGYEDVLSIERKRNTGELAGNLGSQLRRFTAECVRLQSFARRAVICEFSIENVLEFPHNSGIPIKMWKKLRINGKYLAKKVAELSEEFSIEFIFCKDRTEAMMKAHEIFIWTVNNLKR